MQVILETPRLLLRRFEPGEGSLLFELNSDPLVTRYTLDLMKEPVEGEHVLEQVILPQYALYGYGRWAVHTRDNMEFIGWCGLKNRPERKEIDLGYRFMQKSWGNGYATESAFATLRYGLEKLHINRIVGRALPGNHGSIRVLEKCGMNYVGEETVDGLLHITYDIFSPPIP
jgi:ribosomal-protein-alanine N-acetyltransferase